MEASLRAGERPAVRRCRNTIGTSFDACLCDPPYHLTRQQCHCRLSGKQNGVGRVQAARTLWDESVYECPCGAIEPEHATVTAAVYIQVSVPAEFQRSRISDGAGPSRNKDIHEGPRFAVVAQDWIHS